MSILDLILNAQFIEAMAALLWPIGTFIIALVYQEQIKLLLKRITGAKVLGNELKFEVDELRQKIDETVEQQESKVAMITSSPQVAAGRDVESNVERGAASIAERQSEQPMENSDYWWRPAQERRALVPNIPSRGLLPHPLSVTGLEAIYRTLNRPKDAIFVAAKYLEDAMVSLLAAEGKLPPKGLRNPRYLARKIVGGKYLPKEFHEAVEKLVTFETAIAANLASFSQADLTEVARLGAELVELVERVYRDIIFIENARLPVFSDEECRVQVPNYEAVALLFAATPGSTGANVLRITSKIGYYQQGRQVSSEWEDNLKDAGWVWLRRDEHSKPVRLPSDKLFVGRHLEEIVG